MSFTQPKLIYSYHMNLQTLNELQPNLIYSYHMNLQTLNELQPKLIYSYQWIYKHFSLDEQGAPQLINEYPSTCLYEFLWVTKYACPLNTVNETITNDCTAVNPETNYKFDLNALANKTDYEVKDLNGQYNYLLNICQKLIDNKGNL
jgi:hypothetical protein